MSFKKIAKFFLLCFGIIAIVYMTASIVSGDITMKTWDEDTRGIAGTFIAVGCAGAAVFLSIFDDE